MSVYPFCKENKKPNKIVSYEILNQNVGEKNATVSIHLCFESDAFPELPVNTWCLRETYFLKKVRNRWLVDRIVRHGGYTNPSSQEGLNSSESSVKSLKEMNVNVSVFDTINITLPKNNYSVEVVYFGPGYTLEQDLLFLDVYEFDNNDNEILIDKEVALEKCLLTRANCSEENHEIVHLGEDCILLYRYGRPISESKATLTVKCKDEIRNISVYKRYLTFNRSSITFDWDVGETRSLLLTKDNKSYTLNITYYSTNQIIVNNGNREFLFHLNDMRKIFDDLYLEYSKWRQDDDRYETEFNVYSAYSVGEFHQNETGDELANEE